ncbi:MAG: hypothetical protein BGO55_25780 [Sphingobacteriales bacterium 50-39]|nr:hypothetical protein [Sphingobacteriales bacterium]OJW56315.1 MAG: hypothetical protein BGO55_25780 [Sphingobacteriales bacterium 50-39]
MTIYPKLLSLTLILGLATGAYTQPDKSINYLSAIKNYDLSKLWRADSIRTEGDGEKVPFPEPLGYIGNNYQRFYIHYISVTKDKNNPYIYHVYGKTKVKDVVCTFNGAITITRTRLYRQSDDPRYKQGAVTGDIVFKEDSTQPSAGVFKGKVETGFTLDKKGTLQYDALMAVADGYSNNQCTTIWTSYKTGKSKKCNWGDYRIPDSRELDDGAGGVHINERFAGNGWQTFVAAYGSSDKNAEKARQIEDAEWWK